jgi:S-formylglutathione hydrolase FrmB
MKNIILAFSFLVFSLLLNKCYAATVDTIDVYSCLMQKEIKTVVIKPDGYKKKKAAFAVVYLLHGFSGNYSNWISKVPAIKEYADQNKIMIVCPDGGYSSWYINSPIDETYQYESFVANELVHHIDNNYKTIKNSNARALTGLSMGGFGGIYVGLKHPKTFGAIGSMSGALELTLITDKRYQLYKRLGDSTTYNTTWKKYSTFAMIDTIAVTNQSIIVDCGVDDFVLPFNEELHKRLMKRKINHDYILRPGKHDWPYWSNAIQYQIVFFSDFFKKNSAK